MTQPSGSLPALPQIHSHLTYCMYSLAELVSTSSSLSSASSILVHVHVPRKYVSQVCFITRRQTRSMCIVVAIGVGGLTLGLKIQRQVVLTTTREGKRRFVYCNCASKHKFVKIGPDDVRFVFDNNQFFYTPSHHLSFSIASHHAHC